MRKNSYLLALLTIWSLLLAWCNINSLNQDNNKSQTGSEKQTNNTQTSNKWITLYIDKNCEDAWIQYCQKQVWEGQFKQILSWTKVNIVYLDKNSTKEIKDTLWVSPALVIPEDKINAFWQQAAGIEQQAVKKNWNYYVPLYNWIPGEENLCNDSKDNNNDWKIDKNDPTCFSMTILTSSKCKEQYCNKDVLKNMFIGYNLKFIDYETPEWKDLYNKLWTGQLLPTLLYNKNKKYMDNMKNMIKDVNIDWYTKQINIPSFKYDPSIEACETNCNASPSCKKLLSCSKKDVPDVSLYVMAYCPFGTQAEKGIIPVVNLLWDKINFKVKFVDYEMHGKESIDEDNLQYCIQKEQKEKYIPYLTCFLKAWDSASCIKENSIDMDKANTCIKALDKKYNITWLFNDKSTWLNGRFPQYNVYKDENDEYGVQGSPTLVINWIKVQPSSRSPQGYLDTICKAFTKKPAECDKKISDKAYDPSFGWTQNGKAAPAWSCWGK